MAHLMPKDEVRNFGLNASGTVQPYRIFEDRIRNSLHSSDVVIVNFYSNDFSDNITGALSARVVDGEVKTNDPRELNSGHQGYTQGRFVFV